MTTDDAVERVAEALMRHPLAWGKRSIYLRHEEAKEVARAALAAAGAGEANDGRCNNTMVIRCWAWCGLAPSHDGACEVGGVSGPVRGAPGEAVDREALAEALGDAMSAAALDAYGDEGAGYDYAAAAVAFLASPAVLAARGVAAPTVSAEQRDALAAHLSSRLYLSPDDTDGWGDLDAAGRLVWRDEANGALAALGIEVRP